MRLLTIKNQSINQACTYAEIKLVRGGAKVDFFPPNETRFQYG